jgi:hypothetical protein
MTQPAYQSQFEKELSAVEQQMNKAVKLLELIKNKTQNGLIDDAYYMAFDFAALMEKATLDARLLPAFTGNPRTMKTMEHVTRDNVPIRIGFTIEGWFAVVIPMLLPKKIKGTVDFIRTPLLLSLEAFFRGKQPVRYTDCCIVFHHIYRFDRPERKYRDHDNIEINAVVDAIAMYALVDDTSLRCEHFYCSMAGEEDKTEVYVVPQNEVMVWMMEYKMNKNKALILYESIPKKRK